MAVQDRIESNQVLRSTLQQIEREFGKGAIMRLGAGRPEPIEGISTGSLALDLALGGMGVPRGRIVEIFGPESSGKTTLALHVMANAQRAGGIAALIDAEYAFDPTWSKKIGVDLNSLLVSQPTCGEEALQICEMLVKSNAVDVVVIDSVAALVPRAELEGEIGESQPGMQARLMSQALRKLTGAISRSKCCVIFINQIREKIGVMFGSPESTPGGRALKFYATCRIDIRRVQSIKEGDTVIGSRIRAKVVKNKVAPPFRQAEFDLMYDRGISLEGDALDLGLQMRILEKTGSWFSYGETRLGQGRENAKRFLRENPDILQRLVQEIRARYRQEMGLEEPLAAEPVEEGTGTKETKGKKKAKSS